jgi:hypothetical protein
VRAISDVSVWVSGVRCIASLTETVWLMSLLFATAVTHTDSRCPLTTAIYPDARKSGARR